MVYYLGLKSFYTSFAVSKTNLETTDNNQQRHLKGPMIKYGRKFTHYCFIIFDKIFEFL